MESVEFKEVNVRIAEHQEEYETLPVFLDKRDPSAPVTMCFHLDNEEQLQVMETGQIWLTVLTFNNNFQPIAMSCLKPDNFE